jgi:hypothetical protein
MEVKLNELMKMMVEYNNHNQDEQKEQEIINKREEIERLYPRNEKVTENMYQKYSEVLDLYKYLNDKWKIRSIAKNILNIKVQKRIEQDSCMIPL